jgi:hypothetical protein
MMRSPCRLAAKFWRWVTIVELDCQREKDRLTCRGASSPRESPNGYRFLPGPKRLCYGTAAFREIDTGGNPGRPGHRAARMPK